MSANEFNHKASYTIWSALPKEWEGYEIDPTSDAFAQAVGRFQREAGEKVDNKLGDDTWAALQNWDFSEENESGEVYGFDASRHQGEFTEDIDENTNFAYCIHKVSEGIDWTDKCVEHNLHMVYEMPHPPRIIQGYHFGTPHTAACGDAHTDGMQEAVWFASHYGLVNDETFYRVLPNSTPPNFQLRNPDIITFPNGRKADSWLDLESDVEIFTKEEVYSHLSAFLLTAESFGLLFGFYSSKDWFDDFCANYENFYQRADGSIRPFMTARYGTNSDYGDDEIPDRDKYPPDVKVPAPWNTCDIWQYTSKAVIPGLLEGETIDLSVATIGR